MIKFDLTSAYYFLTYPAHRTYLGFAWPNDSGEMCYYKFLVLLCLIYIYIFYCLLYFTKFVGHLFRSGDLRVNLRHFFLTMVLVVPSLTKFLFKMVLK